MKENKTRNFGGALLLLSLLLLSFTACSDDTTSEEEYANWQERNDAYISQLAANGSMERIVTYTKNEGREAADYIYVEKLESGDGTTLPLFTDTVRVAYRGRLIPSASYDDGYVFDQTYEGDFDWTTAGTADFSPGASGLRLGFSTALQNMRVGDRWRVHFSYTLGYGTTANSSIPAYSDLIFDIAVYDIWHQGEVRPAFK